MTRVQGALLFLFIPIVLVLYLRMPLGVTPSIFLGVGLMIGHRFIAKPFLRDHLGTRCFWCGRELAAVDLDAPFASRGETVRARACSEDHRTLLDAFARFVAVARPILAPLILLPVALYLLNAAAWIAGFRGIPVDSARWLFKIPIAFAVVSTSWLSPLGRRWGRAPAVDFPVHNLFLLGIGNTLWVFRIVGLWWLGEGVWRLGAHVFA